MNQNILKRRHPSILAEMITRALHGVRELDPSILSELLARFRRNQVRFIAENGITVNASKEIRQPSNLEFIPLEYYHRIAALDEAYSEFHKYRNGESDQYIAAGVVSEINSLNSKKPRKRKANYKAIANYVIKRGYEKSLQGHGKTIIHDASDKFKCSTRCVYRALKKFGIKKR